ncbi:hypothetical protein JNW88_12260 [Micromonospora sp. ATA32]|nr:hypothetical protein [Micromonospora sp. ATA32]
MAGYAFPTTAYNARAVTPREYEDLMHPMAPDGLIGTPALPALVYADSSLLGVKVRANRAALLRGLRWESGITEVPLTVAPNNTAGTTRKDLIVLRLSRNPWTIGLAVVQGAAVTTPVTPSPTYGEDTSTGVWELPLAEVTVPYNDTLTDAGQCVPLAWYVGADGQILCTATPATTPPHLAGRRKYETDTGREFVSNGTDWRVVMDDATGVITAAGGISHSNAVLSRRNGQVTFALTVWRPNGPLNANTEYSLGNVPDGFRPLVKQPSTGVCPSAQSVLTYSVGVDGAIVVNPGATAIPTGRACVLAAMSWPRA